MATILFVDDDEMERYFAREILEPRGHRVLYAGDGETALRIFGSESVDVVVTDLAMPRLNGLRLIQQLLEEDPRVRVIAASGVNADQLDLAEDFGAVAVLKKPWDPRAFLDTLERILSEDRNRKLDIDEVWPTLYAGIELDEEGKVVRTTPHEVRPPEEELPPPPPPRKTPQPERIDLGLEGLELEVEDIDADPPDFEIESDEDDDAQP
jgi:CheY-like chemotaxis protein